MAAAYLLAELRAVSETSQHVRRRNAVLIGDEAQACYNRVLLSSLLAGECELSDLDMCQGDEYLSIITGRRVVEIDSAEQVLKLDDGQVMPYSDVVISTGATVPVPEAVPSEAEGVQFFRSLTDLDRLRTQSGRAKNAVVIGGGLLGLEAAWGLHLLGLTVTVVHRNEFLMNRQLDEGGSSELRRQLEAAGLQFELGTVVTTTELSEGKVSGIRLASGRRVDCELLVCATGISPNTELAQSAGLAVDRGVCVDSFLQTGIPSVHALGECIQLGAMTYGLVAPIRRQAHVLAKRLMRIDTPPYEDSDDPTQLKVSGVHVFSAGDIRGDGEHIELTSRKYGIYRKLFVRDGRLVGAVLVGDRSGAAVFTELIQSRVDIGSLRHQLMFNPQVPDTSCGDVMKEKGICYA